MRRDEVDRSKLSPMMLQYMDIKDNYEDTIIFFRLGDFYEMFFDDAVLVSRELELTLTGKQAGLEERVPMCGVPHHAYANYIDQLIEKGYLPAIRLGSIKILRSSLERFLEENEGKDFTDLDNIVKLTNIPIKEED